MTGQWLAWWVSTVVAAVALVVMAFAWLAARRSTRGQLLAEERLRVLLDYRVVVTSGASVPDAGGNLVDLSFGALQTLAAGEPDLPPMPLIRGQVAAWCLGPAPRRPRNPGRAVQVRDAGRNERDPGPAQCPTCRSPNRYHRLDLWEADQNRHARCPDDWHPEWALMLDSITKPLPGRAGRR